MATVRLHLAQALFQIRADRVRTHALAEAAREGLANLGRRGERSLRTATELVAATQ
jgi:hypothetical protein